MSTSFMTINQEVENAYQSSSMEQLREKVVALQLENEILRAENELLRRMAECDCCQGNDIYGHEPRCPKHSKEVRNAVL